MFFCSPTGSGKSLCFEIAPFVYDYVNLGISAVDSRVEFLSVQERQIVLDKQVSCSIQIPILINSGQDAKLSHASVFLEPLNNFLLRSGFEMSCPHCIQIHSLEFRVKETLKNAFVGVEPASMNNIYSVVTEIMLCIARENALTYNPHVNQLSRQNN